jgi:dTDP-3-amino-2,3,6-trideoxy-4-keto-D-glucose/dTDP-3-amino-3,4,6-trideoxy-alpha-D-glucose/dTDP-2,6-dideoxy-D-kanosamine transaminase
MSSTVIDVPFNDLRRFATNHGPRLLAVSRRVIESGWYSLGPETEAFEAAFGTACGSRHCVAVGNGTDALEIALRSLGCGPGDEVIVTANAGMYATAACLSIGAVPVYAEIDPATLLVSSASAAALAGPRTRVLVATHLYGNVVDVPRLRQVLPSNVRILEDAAQAHGAKLEDHVVGSLGDAAAFSFYPTKNLGALGDAGAIVTADEDVARCARALRQYGWEARYLATVPRGRNSRIDEIQAAFLLELMPDLQHRNRRRQAIWGSYERALSGRVRFAELAREGVEPAAHLCVVRTAERDRLRDGLKSAGVGSAVHYPVPDHKQRALDHTEFRHAGLGESERACSEVVSLPCFPELEDDEVDRVIAAVDRFA